MRNAKRARELSPQERARTVLPVPEVRLAEARAAAVRVLRRSVDLAHDPWLGRQRKVRPVMAGQVPGMAASADGSACPGILGVGHPMETLTPDAAIDAAGAADPGPPSGSGSPSGPSASSGSGASGPPPGPGPGLGLVVPEVMDAEWSYVVEDPREPRLSRDGLRLTADGEDTASQILFDRIQAHEQVIAWHRARQYQALAQAAQLPVPPSSGGPLPGAVDITAYDCAVAELGAMLRMPRPRADGVLGMAVILSTLPRFLRMMEAGDLDEDRALAVARAMSVHLSGAGYPDPRWDAVEERVARRAPDRTRAQLADDVRRAVIAVDSDLAEERRAKARREREVRTFARPDGMGELSAVLTAEAVAIIDQALTLMADAARDQNRLSAEADPDDPSRVDERTHQQRRADALTGVFSAILDGRTLPYYPANFPHLQHPAWTRRGQTPPWLQLPAGTHSCRTCCPPAHSGRPPPLDAGTLTRATDRPHPPETRPPETSLTATSPPATRLPGTSLPGTGLLAAAGAGLPRARTGLRRARTGLRRASTGLRAAALAPIGGRLPKPPAGVMLTGRI